MPRYRRTRAELEIIDAAIVAAARKEAPVTVRGLYYRLVSQKLIPKDDTGYGLVIREARKLRQTHVLPWHHIVDGSRHSVEPWTYPDVGSAISEIADVYRRDLWLDQSVRVQVWVEKDAMTNVIAPVIRELHVPLHIARGQVSLTFVHEIAAELGGEYPLYVYGLGDHDDVGVKAWENIQARIREFAPDMADLIRFERLAAKPEQVAEYGLLTHDHKRDRSGKLSDKWLSRAEAEGFDPTQAIELDAFDSNTIRRIVRNAIEGHIDPEKREATKRVEDGERKLLAELADEHMPDDDGIAARKEAAKSQRAETVRKSAALRVKLSTQVRSIRADHPALRDECDRLSATLADAPTITKAHARAVRDLLVSAVLAVDVELDEG